MVKTLELAISKAATLPEAAQEALGKDLLEKIEALAALRAEIDAGIADLDAGRDLEIDFDALLKELNDEHANRT